MLRALLFAIALATGWLLYAAWPKEQVLDPSPEAIAELKKLRMKEKYVDQFGIIKPEERSRLEPVINNMLDGLISGLPKNPKKSWVLAEMKKAVVQFYLEDTELREPSVEYVEQTLRILRIEQTNLAFARYFIFL
jgi:hypothetical protein